MLRLGEGEGDVEFRSMISGPGREEDDARARYLRCEDSRFRMA